MQFALNENNEKIIPQFSGQQARCQYCRAEMIGCCGEIYDVYWRHKNKNECDSWFEPETEWHRNWKNNFPKDFREIIIIDEVTKEKHIADIKTKSNLVIEFQNSSISTVTIKERERFYKNMVWVINADSFKSNFKIYSVVTSELRNLENKHRSEIDDIILRKKSLLRSAEKDIAELKNEISYIDSQIASDKSDLLRMDILSKKKIDISKEIYLEWYKDQFIGGESVFAFKYAIESNIKPKVLRMRQRVFENKKLYEENRKCLEIIQNFKDFILEDKSYKIIEFKYLNKANFKRAFLINRNEVDCKTYRPNNLFPRIKQIKDESEFNRLCFSQNDYIIFMDVTDRLLHYNEEIKNHTKVKSENEALEIEIIEEIQELFADWIVNKIAEIERNTKELSEKRTKKDELLKLKVKFCDNYLKENEKKLKEEFQDIEKGIEVKRFEIKRNFKRIYTCNWKHRRKTWDSACCKIYFDIGEDYLFEKINGDKFIKIDKQVFIDGHKNNL